MFSGTLTIQDCTSLGTAGGVPPYITQYNSVTFKDGYSKSVTTIAQPVTYNTFILNAPLATFTPYSNVTVPTKLTWTGGTYGAPNAPTGGTLIVQGGTTAAPSRITPADGATIQCGTKVRAEGSAVLEISTAAGATGYGTLKFTTAKTLAAAGSSAVNVDGVKFTSSVTAPDAIEVLGSSSAVAKLTVADLESATGLSIDGGTASITGPDVVKFNGKVGSSGVLSVEMQKGMLVIDNGTTLEVPTANQVRVWGGKLATRAISTGNQSDAVIKTNQLSVAQLWPEVPTEIKISDTALNGVGVTGHQFGRLHVDGQVYWTGGTYSPVVDGLVTNGVESDRADLWDASGTFSIDGTVWGSHGAKVVPQAVNLPAGNNTGRYWKVIASFQSIVYNVAPPNMVPDATWKWSRSDDTTEAYVSFK